MAAEAHASSDPLPADAALAEIDGAAPEPLPSGRFSRHAWILRRILLGLVTLLTVSILIFVATQALPTNAAELIAGKGADPSRVAEIEASLGLDRSVPEQYLDWIGGVLTGDLGTSLLSKLPVSELIGDALINSATLLLLAAVIAIPLSIVLGVVTAMKRGGRLDSSTTGVTLILNAMPDFLVGLTLIVLFSTTVFTGLFPPVSVIPPGTNPLASPDALVLPVATVVLVTAPYLTRLVRGSMIDALESDYVEHARLLGQSRWRVAFVQALPNSLAPLIQGSGLVLGVLASEMVVIEFLFNYPGIGRVLADAVGTRDVPIIQAVALILAAFYVVVNLVADILTVYASPRLRTGGR